MKKILFVAFAIIAMMVSCVKDPQYPGVTISNVTYYPTAVQDMDDVTVTATITSFKEITASLYYSVNDEKDKEVVMTSTAEKNVFSAVIPGQPNDAKVKFHIVAKGELVATSPEMEYVVGAVAIDYSVLRLNELNGNDKFIEIYNAGTEELNLNGVYMEKDGEQNWVAENLSVKAGDYLLLYSEDVTADHEGYPENMIFHSGLSAKKNVRIQLFTPAGESIDDFNLVDIDQNDPSMIPAPGSYSRNADGQWFYADATPGAVNVDGTIQVMGLEGGPEGPNYKNLVINELNGIDKFIEFYNKGNLDLTMEGMYLMKDDKTDPIWTADATIVIPAHGYVLLYSGDVLADHPEMAENLFFNSGLSAKKTVRIALYMADGTERDVFTRGITGDWGQTISEVSGSFARTPDGGDWKLADPTPGQANPATGDDIPQE